MWNHVTQEVWMFMKEISSDGDVSTVSTVVAIENMQLHHLTSHNCTWAYKK